AATRTVSPGTGMPMLSSAINSPSAYRPRWFSRIGLRIGRHNAGIYGSEAFDKYTLDWSFGREVTRLGGITKRGNRYLRRLLINGASANLLRSKATTADPWVIGIRRRRPPLVVAVALANRTARIAWAAMLPEEEYQPRAVAA